MAGNSNLFSNLGVSTALNIYLELALSAGINVITIYFLKKHELFTAFWPTVWVVITIVTTQWLVSRAIHSGMDVGIATVVTMVIIGSTLMGLFAFDESLSTLKIVGISVAVLGVFIANIAK